MKVAPAQFLFQALLNLVGRKNRQCYIEIQLLGSLIEMLPLMFFSTEIHSLEVCYINFFVCSLEERRNNA
jgi:hypothetical protein